MYVYLHVCMNQRFSFLLGEDMHLGDTESSFSIFYFPSSKLHSAVFSTCFRRVAVLMFESKCSQRHLKVIVVPLVALSDDTLRQRYSGGT